MAAWPGGLPQVPQNAGNEETYEDNVVRTTMDAGPVKSRMRYTAATRPASYQFLMTDAELATFITFYESTVSYGSLEFDFTHPQTGSTESMRFVQPPKWTEHKDDLWRVFCEWEMLP